MNILVLGGSGNTGQCILNKLLWDNHNVKAVVRKNSSLPNFIKSHEKLTIIEGNVLGFTEQEIILLIQDCDVIVSSLGHNLTFKGMFCNPRLLVTQTLKKLSIAIQNKKTNNTVKILLMNSSGVQNRDLNEYISFSQKCIILLLKMLLPPHLDNEKAANFLRAEITSNNSKIEWVIIRPDSLIDENTASQYKAYLSPIRSAIFDAGKTSRINVAHFMSELISNTKLWEEWKGKMPVLYNKHYTKL